MTYRCMPARFLWRLSFHASGKIPPAPRTVSLGYPNHRRSKLGQLIPKQWGKRRFQ
jgi:hypothetical protein